MHNVINLNGCDGWMSDTFECCFTVAGVVYTSVYQYLVCCKAKLNGRKDLLNRIKHSKSVQELQGLDKEIEVVDERYWSEVYTDSKNVATIQKFMCNQCLRDKLVSMDYSRKYKVVGGKIDFSTLRSVQFVMSMEDY